MLSKEEIEKAKEWLNWMKKEDLFLPYISNILKYIDKLEKENNKQNKIINETINYIASLDIKEDISSFLIILKTNFENPSANFNIILPTKASHTKTSTTPSQISLASTFP